MRRLGLLGGMSWESSIEYERIINEVVRKRLGGTHSADLIIRSFDFALIERLQQFDDWKGAADLLADEARSLERIGADAIVLCTNTMHRVADEIAAATTIPLLHIADPTGDAVVAAGLHSVVLLGTRYTMEQSFIRARLQQRGINVLVPSEPDRTTVHDIIFEELVRGVITDASRVTVAAVVERLAAQGAEGVVAGCTEIELLLRPSDIDVVLFPTARLHAESAAAWALSGK